MILDDITGEGTGQVQRHQPVSGIACKGQYVSMTALMRGPCLKSLNKTSRYNSDILVLLDN